VSDTDVLHAVIVLLFAAALVLNMSEVRK